MFLRGATLLRAVCKSGQRLGGLRGSTHACKHFNNNHGSGSHLSSGAATFGILAWAATKSDQSAKPDSIKAVGTIGEVDKPISTKPTSTNANDNDTHDDKIKTLTNVLTYIWPTLEQYEQSTLKIANLCVQHKSEIKELLTEGYGFLDRHSHLVSIAGPVLMSIIDLNGGVQTMRELHGTNGKFADVEIHFDKVVTFVFDAFIEDIARSTTDPTFEIDFKKYKELVVSIEADITARAGTLMSDADAVYWRSLWRGTGTAGLAMVAGLASLPISGTVLLAAVCVDGYNVGQAGAQWDRGKNVIHEAAKATMGYNECDVWLRVRPAHGSAVTDEELLALATVMQKCITTKLAYDFGSNDDYT